MATEIDSLKNEIKRLEFTIWAANDEITRRKAAVKKIKQNLKILKAKMKKAQK